MLEPNLPSPGKRVTNTTLSFKGAKIFQSALEEMAEKGMNYAKKALLVGESAGGVAAMLHCDEFSNSFHSFTQVNLFRWPTIKAGECNNGDHQFEAARKPRIPFQRRKKKGNNGEASATVFKRSKSANTPRNRMGFLENDENDRDDSISPRKRGFWSFLYYSASKKIEKPGWGVKDSTFPSSSASVNGSNVVMRDKKRESFGVGEENERSEKR
nr:uncharacterized protein LOC109176080 [Ipomoea trifida]